MLGLLFTFDVAAVRLAVQTPVFLTQALQVARAGQHIAYQEIRPCGEAHSQVAVLFSDLGQLDGFTARLTRALLPSGIAIAELRAVPNGACQ